MNHIASPLCSRSGSFLLLGIALIIFGTIALSSAFITTMATVMLFGGLMVAAGIAQIVHAFYTSEWRGFFAYIVLGILGAVVGWLMLIHPTVGAVSLTLLLATFFIAGGLFKIASALMHDIEHKGWFILSGIVSLALGLLIFAQWPASSLWIIGLFIGTDMIVSGWTYVMWSFSLRKHCTLTAPKDLAARPVQDHETDKIAQPL